MKTAQAVTDKLAIGLSLLCTIHCLALPLLLALLPSMAALQLDKEAFHMWMVIAVLPSSIYALSLGCKQHKRYRLFFLGSIGIALLILALALGEERIGETGEKILTVLGASFVAVGHWFNYRLCRTHNHKNGSCPNDKHLGEQ